ncbi:MAG TPA: Uma2 family endonuclease, partial [Gemmatirosa sp.]
MTTAVKLDAPARARTNPPTTAEELQAWYDDDPGEIVDGVFVPKYPDGVVTGPGVADSIVAVDIGVLVANHVKQHRLGRVLASGAATRLRRAPDLVRCPDSMFVSTARLGGGISRGVLEGPPDLAVEVRSPNDRPGEVGRKIADYLAHGVRTVWDVDPDARTITVHRPGALPRALRGDDVLDCGEVLPGFRVATRDVFADLDLDA